MYTLGIYVGKPRPVCILQYTHNLTTLHTPRTKGVQVMVYMSEWFYIFGFIRSAKGNVKLCDELQGLTGKECATASSTDFHTGTFSRSFIDRKDEATETKQTPLSPIRHDLTLLFC